MTRSNVKGLNVKFAPGRQDAFISGRGADMVHEIALSCTCRAGDAYSRLQGDTKEKRRAPFCKRCGGTGWLYRDAQLVRGIVTNIRQQRNILDAGTSQPGDLLFSPGTLTPDCSGERRIGAWDKLTATWPQPVDDGHVIQRGAAFSGDNAELVTGLRTDEDRLWYEPASSVWCEDEAGKRYSEGEDFVLGPGRVIRWVGAAPRIGQLYTIKYNAYFEWIVFQPPTERIDTDGTNLGPIVYLRKRHIALLNEGPAVIDDDRVSFSARVKC